ncbi:Exocyst complex component Sec6 [Rasamsonia emersonii CBS 393.64]|uniref:Exocyst complex component Sec6 n=1 Tax=Rasamsonia emersonii (strain ATCC 16479 / CBS 393.64 / IMI 116815) TaxID=1408163 RepID=A0A0F4YPA2_RASE3|nr:Exocyst complex component Sec6 [Rasamsonia emersonii CBS 393.64]KKA19463.1 Exocyst complex component Sec6 [Rasamsonia emersonii CBS 393.64]
MTPAGSPLKEGGESRATPRHGRSASWTWSPDWSSGKVAERAAAIEHRIRQAEAQPVSPCKSKVCPDLHKDERLGREDLYPDSDEVLKAAQPEPRSDRFRLETPAERERLLAPTVDTGTSELPVPSIGREGIESILTRAGFAIKTRLYSFRSIPSLRSAPLQSALVPSVSPKKATPIPARGVELSGLNDVAVANSVKEPIKYSSLYLRARNRLSPIPYGPDISSPFHCSDNMAKNEGSEKAVAIPRLEELLRHPEDLDKIPALKAEYTRKKAAVDAQLREGLRDQLERVQQSLAILSEGQRQVSKTRDELQTIDKLCAESQTNVDDFAQIDKLARIQRNFEAVIMMKKGLESFSADVAQAESLLREDDEDLENQPNLLRAHMLISRLRDFRDEALDQIRKAKDASSEATLLDYFQGLDSVIDWFDDHLGTACMNLIPLVQSDNRSMVVRLAVVISREEKNDETVRALQEAQKDHEDLASRFKSMNIGPKTVRGYKEKFLQAIELYAQNQFDATKEEFLSDPDKLEKSFKWFFNDLYTVQQGMQSLMPKKWKIYNTYTKIYHRMMHDFLVGLIDDPELPSDNLLAIIHWSEKYYKKMAKLGWKQSDLVPNILDDREPELIRQWQNVILNAVDEWMERIFATEKKALVERTPDALETNAEGYFRTKTLGDMWRMLHEQIQAASASERADVIEGVIDSMFRALKGRQTAWQTLLDEECAKYKTASPDNADGLQQLQDWLIAVANDQIACIDDNEETGQIGYLTRFKRDLEPLVTPKYMASRATPELEALRDGYVDLSTHCLSQFVNLIFTVDFRTTLPDFFTQKWYGEFAIKRMTSTFEDYMSDYNSVLHPSLIDILVEELSDVLLIQYLSAVRNRGVKFRRQDPFTEKFKDDVLTVFNFFQKYPESFAATIKQKWRLVDWLVRLLEAEKGAGVVSVYEAFKNEYWDLHLSWVEAVLRTRDDFDRSMISSIKAKAAELNVERGLETIMSKVR